MPDAGAAPNGAQPGHGEELRLALRAAGFDRVPPAVATARFAEPCPVLSWAASGAMALTGCPGRPPRWPAGAVVGRLGAALALVEAVAGARWQLDPAAVLTARAAARGLSRQGTVSAGGRCRLLRAADGWVAVSLARAADAAAVPALVGRRLPTASPTDQWAALAGHVAGRPAAGTLEQARLLGLPVAALPDPASLAETATLPWRVTRAGQATTPATAGRAGAAGRPGRLVVDLSALWAGPTCAWLLGLAGATVVKVEDLRRPDTARHGDRWLFGHLHAGHRSVALDLGRPAARAALGRLVSAADVVVEASRPRALDALGLSPAAFLADRPGRTWVSISGYGREGADAGRVAFGDDAAVGGGLVARAAGEPPVFCADAVADPLAGAYAAVAAVCSLADGGGHHVECSMAAAAAFANRRSDCPAHHAVRRTGGRWMAGHADRWVPVAEPRAAPLAAGAHLEPVADFGSDTDRVLGAG
ncbi:MAG: CoA transferase [Acidimicrobiales bacterium]